MSDITKTQVALRLPADQIERVDERAKALDISRNEWFENATRWLLDNTATVDKKNAAHQAAIPQGQRHQWKKDGNRNRCERCGILDGMFSYTPCVV